MECKKNTLSSSISSPGFHDGVLNSCFFPLAAVLENRMTFTPRQRQEANLTSDAASEVSGKRSADSADSADKEHSTDKVEGRPSAKKPKQQLVNGSAGNAPFFVSPELTCDFRG